MPFICLTRNDIPDGTVQILDLKPNESQRVPSMDAPGQTRYVNRVQRDPVEFDASGYLAAEAKGLAAYLADRVLPGGLGSARATVTATGPHDGDTVTIAGVPFTAKENLATGTVKVEAACAALDTVVINGTTFTAKHAAPLSNVQFLDAQAPNTAITSATSLAAQITAHPVVGLLLSAASGGTDTADLTTITPRGLGGQYTLVGTGGRLTVSGATMIAAVPAAASQEFAGILQAVGGTNTAVATSLAAAINDAASQLLLVAAIGHAPHTVAAVPAVAVVTVTYSVVGDEGLGVTFVSSTGVRLPVASTLTGFLGFPTVTMPTKAQYTTVADGIVTRLDAGLPLALANINTVLTTTFGATGLTTGGSTGTVADVLSILAGREYRLPVQVQKFAPTWDSTQMGSFTHVNPEFGTHMIAGEWKPAAMPFDAVNVENKPVRATYNGSSFQISIAAGALSHFAAGVTLFPDSDLVEFHVSQHQKALTYPQVNGARLVTVYDDDGTVLV